MVKRLTREEILNGKDAYLYDGDTLYVEIGDDVVYGLHRDNSEWFEKGNFYDYFDCPSMWSYILPISKELAAGLAEEWMQRAALDLEELALFDAERLDEAVRFATEKHARQFRKGTKTPYIVHPMEVMTILSAMGADVNLMIAGVLHDTVEDTDATIKEISSLFGADVAMLVGGHSEDKSKDWIDRKRDEQHATAGAPFRMKQLVLADKLANMRSLLRDHGAIGEKLWERFNACKGDQAWYYSRMIDVLDEMQRHEATAEFYWELNAGYKDLFVEFFIDEYENVLYQVDFTGDCYKFEKAELKWEGSPEGVSDKALRLTRKQLERIEDSWVDWAFGRTCFGRGMN